MFRARDILCLGSQRVSERREPHSIEKQFKKRFFTALSKIQTILSPHDVFQ